MPESISTESSYLPITQPVSPASSGCASMYSEVTHTSQSPLCLTSQPLRPSVTASPPPYQPPSGEYLAKLLTRLTPTGQAVLEKIAAGFYCPKPGQSLVSFAQRLADLAPGLTWQDLAIMLDTELATMQAVKIKQVWLSPEGVNAQRIIASNPELAKAPNETRADHANRLKHHFPELTPRDGSLLSGASYGMVRPSASYTSKLLSEAGQQVSEKIRQGQLLPKPHQSDLEYCYWLWQMDNRLNLIDMSLLTPVSRNVLERHWVFITCQLSDQARKIQKMLQDHQLPELQRNINEDKASWVRRVLGDPSRLTRSEAAVVFKLTIKTLNDIPEYISKPLTEAGMRVHKLRELGDALYLPYRDEDSISCIRRIKRMLEPNLTVTDAAKLALVRVSSLIKYQEFWSKSISEQARKQIDANLKAAGTACKRAQKEKSQDFVLRIKQRYAKYKPREIAMVTGLSISTVRRALANSLKTPPSSGSRPATAPTPVVERPVETTAAKSHPPALAARPVNPPPAQTPRPVTPLPAQASRPVTPLPALAPRPVNPLPAQAPRPVGYPPVLAATTLNPAPALTMATASYPPLAPSLHAWLLTPVNRPPTYETDYARAQWVSLSEIDRRLAASGWMRVPNSAYTGTRYANCLIIALLQHVFEDYTENRRLFDWVNYFRDRLLNYRWMVNPHLFGDDGYMAFGHHSDIYKSAAAVLIDMINEMLIQTGQPPLVVINHSYAADRHYEDWLGLQTANSRLVHIVNTGQHFEALLPAASHRPYQR